LTSWWADQGASSGSELPEESTDATPGDPANDSPADSLSDPSAANGLNITENSPESIQQATCRRN
jgi:hypothetical protein